MALEIKLNQKLSQSLVMTPQLQQAIKLLQLGRLEYLEVIEKELLENPVLEDGGEESDRPGDLPSDAELAANSKAEENKEQASSDDNVPDAELQELLQDFQKTFAQSLAEDRTVDTDNEAPSDHWAPSRNSSQTFEDDRPSLEATLTKPEGLVSHILWQLRTTELDDKEKDIAVQIVGNLDRNGYLQIPINEIAELCSCDVETVERVLSVVQTLDPAGLGARDLRECLLIQLDQLGLQDTLVWRVVSEHLPKLEIKRYDLIAKEEKVAVEEVYEAVKEIQKLEPRPGRPFVDEEPIYITPDIYVRRVGDDFVISLNEQGMPRLRVNTQYRELLSNGKIQDMPNKEYLQDRLRAATWLIRSVYQRQQTIYKVTESIMKFQREFLDEGVSALKPLVLRDVAAEVGMHESTVSRVTTNKYVHTPQGVFELKFFFSSGLRTGAGAVSSESVKDRIRALVAAEDPKKPLSDQAIVNILKEEGVDIARRTVAKYREMMNILSSSRRKKVF